MPIIVLVTTLQTGAEEVLFRGYLLQTAGLFTRRGWLLVAGEPPELLAAHPSRLAGD